MNVWGICWLTFLNRCHLITVIVSGSCLWWETGIHDTSCINSCIWSSCAAAWIKHLYPINVTSRCSYWLYPHGGGVCVLFWTHGHLHGLDVTHRWEATWKLNGLICLIASGLQTSIFVPAATRPLVLRRVFMPCSVFFTQIVTSRTQRPRNTDVTLSQHEHVRAEGGTVDWQNSHIYNLPAVPPFYSGQSDLLTAAWSLTSQPPGSYQPRNL